MRNVDIELVYFLIHTVALARWPEERNNFRNRLNGFHSYVTPPRRAEAAA